MQRIEKLRKILGMGEAAYISSFANVFYYSGFQSADASFLVTADRAVLITDSRYFVQAKIQSPDFEIYNIKDTLAGVFSQVSCERVLYEEEAISAGAFERLKKAAPGREFLPAQKKISEPRAVKEETEIRRIRAAEEFGDAAFSHVLGIIGEGVTEREIAFELEFFMRKNGASGLSFETIAASGERSAMPHGVATDRRLRRGDLLTLDFGCVLDGYCSDMTRTVGIGELSERARELYEVTLRAQKTAIAAVKSGAELSAVDAAARNVIADAGFGEYFSHALGHSVGIEIHENPCFSPRSTGNAERGNVITVEPGIYIEGFGGVRIEDLVAVTDEGCEILSKSPKELIIL